jgi:hypothetical protein
LEAKHRSGVHAQAACEVIGDHLKHLGWASAARDQRRDPSQSVVLLGGPARFARGQVDFGSVPLACPAAYTIIADDTSGNVDDEIRR